MAERVAIVTGAGRGIGRAVALTLARDGWDLTLAARTGEQLSRVAHTVRRRKVSALAAPTDVTVAAEVQAMVDATMEAFGRVDLLVNVAGSAHYVEDPSELTVEQFDEMIATNLRGVFLTTRAVWPIMRQQRDGGCVVNVSSLSARDPFPGFAVYGAAKGAVNLLTQSLAKAGRAHNIRLYAVCPGYVETSMLRGLFPDVPAEDCLAPSQVADLVAWCATDAARPCTGQALWLSRK